MNNDKPDVLLDQIPNAVHSDNLLEFLNTRVIPRVQFLTDRYNGVEIPKHDPVSEYAKANSIGHLPRSVQEAAYNAANPTAKVVIAEMSPLEKYASENGLTHLPTEVQQAAYDSAEHPAPLMSERE